MKGTTKTIKNETKEQKGRFLGMLLDTLGASLLGNMLTGKGMLRAGYGNKEGKGMLRPGCGSKGSSILLKKSVLPPSFDKLWNRAVLLKWT